MMTWEEMNRQVCNLCCTVLKIGDWPYCPHGQPTKSKGFEPYHDLCLDQTVTGVGDINKACRPRWENDHIVRIEPRDKSAAYYRELNQRREYRHQIERKERQS